MPSISGEPTQIVEMQDKERSLTSLEKEQVCKREMLCSDGNKL